MTECQLNNYTYMKNQPYCKPMKNRGCSFSLKTIISAPPPIPVKSGGGGGLLPPSSAATAQVRVGYSNSSEDPVTSSVPPNFNVGLSISLLFTACGKKQVNCSVQTMQLLQLLEVRKGKWFYHIHSRQRYWTILV